jgi:phosphoenolpyruvate phosphomutase
MIDVTLPGHPGAQLRRIMTAGEPALLLEAHNAVSARIAEEAGADGVWVSSLTLSCAYGLPDDESITMAQAIEAVAAIVARVGVPVLFDGDTGYGGPSQLTTLVRSLSRCGMAGISIEDKVAPKCNSLLASAHHVLATTADFCERLRVAKAAPADPSFVVVARTETLIAGRPLDEALSRAEAYVDAGADAVLVHSKAPTFAEVEGFMRLWRRRAPIICVPTTYASTAPQAFADAGIGAVIWANHMMRAAIAAMQSVASAIVRQKSAAGQERAIAPVAELWRLQAPDPSEARAAG